jgi:hypothetical protein
MSLPPFFFSDPTPKQNLYICIATIKGYEVALDRMVASLPKQFNYIVVFSNEPEEKYEIVHDKRINVYIKNNIYEYGTWVGVNYLIENNVVHGGDWFLFTHDTAEFGPRAYPMICKMLARYTNTNTNLVWLDAKGASNICLIRNDAIPKGADKYKDILTMSKEDAIEFEWNYDRLLSPKSIQTSSVFEGCLCKSRGVGKIYNGLRRIELDFQLIDMKKFYHYVHTGITKHLNVP